jgi:hypothetical protein
MTSKSYFLEIWNFKLSLVPVLVTYFIFELPALVRRVRRWLYTPIYFMFFPLGHADHLYAQYFNEDDFYRIGADQTPDEKETVRRRIIAISVLSMIISSVAAPWLTGFLAAFYLSESIFSEFVLFLISVKIITLIYSLGRMRRAYFVDDSNSFYFVVLTYVFYLIMIWWGVTNAFSWTTDKLNSVGPILLFLELFRFFYKEILVSIVIVGAGTWALTQYYTDPKLIRPPHDPYND